MNTQLLKEKTKKALTGFGYGKEANELIDKYWNLCEYIKSPRNKALFMIS